MAMFSKAANKAKGKAIGYGKPKSSAGISKSTKGTKQVQQAGSRSAPGR